MRNVGKVFFFKERKKIKQRKKHCERKEIIGNKERRKERKEKEERSNLFSAINYIVYSNLRSSSKVKVLVLIYDNALRGMANI